MRLKINKRPYRRQMSLSVRFQLSVYKTSVWQGCRIVLATLIAAAQLDILRSYDNVLPEASGKR